MASGLACDHHHGKAIFERAGDRRSCDRRAIHQLSMKALLAFGLLTVSLVFTGCEAYVVDRHPAVYRSSNRGYSHRPYYHRPTVVAYHDDDRYYSDRRYYGSGYRSSHYAPSTRIIYSTDRRGRYYV